MRWAAVGRKVAVLERTTGEILLARRPARRQRPTLTLKAAVELHEKELSLHFHGRPVDHGSQIVVALKRRPIADVHDDLPEADVPLRKRLRPVLVVNLNTNGRDC